MPQTKPDRVAGDADMLASRVRAALGSRSLVLVGLMGCGKSSVGKRLGVRLALPFVDADDEIEKAAAKSIGEIFADHGEAHFRDGERRVIARLLSAGPQVLATGGGAFMNPETRAGIKTRGVSVWLRAELPTLMRRVMKRDSRPLLKSGDPEAVMRDLMIARYPVYSEADVIVQSRDVPHDTIVSEVMQKLGDFLLAPKPAQTREENGRVGAQTSSSKEPRQGDRAEPDPPSPRAVRVALGARAYDVLIGGGLIAQAGRLIAEKFPGAKLGVVTDETVARHHLPALRESLESAGMFAGEIVLPAGEATKSFRELGPLCERLLAMGLERGDLVLAFGGGVVGDLAGFAAGVLRRGARFVQIPTTLLAQVDSSVGGKTGINTPQGKNLIGVFHQPSLVLADTDALATLPAREMRAGYAEVVKYAFLGDAAFFKFLETNGLSVLAREPGALVAAIETSVKAKAAIVARDETETGDRALLNLGHTFGHALEAWAGYSSRLLHGEAVAIGMAMAFRFSVEQSFCAAACAEAVARHLETVGLPTRIRDIPGGEDAAPAALLALMEQDKKMRRGQMTLILARGVGQAFIARDVPREKIAAFLEAEVARGA